MSSDPQFGVPQPGRPNRDRPAAFGLAARAGFLALVRVESPNKAPFHDLPGGAIDAGEDAAQAMVREFGEETGLVVEPGPQVCRASQYFALGDGEAVNNRCTFLVATVMGEDGALKSEDDHSLVWMAPDEALRGLRHDAQAWAVAAWLRQQGS
jgi:8-oxo-dGTP diphosphatase